MQLEPKVNRTEADHYNCFFLEMAPQKAFVSQDSGKKVLASFDWENKLTVKLDFADICEFLAVLEGRIERVGGQKNGIFHRNSKGCTVIGLQRNADKGGFYLGLSRKDNDTGRLTRVSMLLSEPEASGLRAIFQTGMFFIIFSADVCCRCCVKA